MNNGTVGDPGFFLGGLGVAQGVLHPVDIVTLGEVITGVSSTGLFSVLSSVHGHLTLDEEVLQFHSFNQVGVPNLTAIGDTNSVIVLRNGM